MTFSPRPGEKASDYMLRDPSFSIGPGGSNWVWKPEEQRWGPAGGNTASPAPSPTTVPPAAPTAAPPTASASTAQGAEQAALTGLHTASTGGTGMTGPGPAEDAGSTMLNAPNSLRQGIGTRTPPLLDMVLASLRRIY